MTKFMLLALTASLSLAACERPIPNDMTPASTPSPVAGPSSAESCGLASGTLVDEKALYGAEIAYNVPANAYVTLDTNGQLTIEIKSKVKPLLIGAYDALVVARSAYKLGDVCTFNAAVTNVKQLATSAKAFLPHKE